MPYILCVIVLLMEWRALALSPSGGKWKALAFYTRLSNLITALSAVQLIFMGQPRWVTAFRYLSTCMLVMTFFVTTCVLIPMGGDPKRLLWSGSGLYHHVLCPVVSTLSYIFAENHVGPGMIWLPVLTTFLYGMILLYLNGIRKVDGPYPFFRVHHQSAGMTVLWMTVLTAAIAGISALVCVCAGL